VENWTNISESLLKDPSFELPIDPRIQILFIYLSYFLPLKLYRQSENYIQCVDYFA